MIVALVAMVLMAQRAPATELHRDAVMAFATCVRRRAPDRVAGLLASEPGSDDERRKIAVIAGAYNSCLVNKSGLSFAVELLRGQLAELAFRDDAALRDRAVALPAGPPVRPDLAGIEKAAAGARQGNRDQLFASAFRTRFARCVTDASPRTVASLLPTAPASAEERAALVKAGDTLMGCMPEGLSYHIVPAELRPYLLSQLYYRAATHAATGT